MRSPAGTEDAGWSASPLVTRPVTDAIASGVCSPPDARPISTRPGRRVAIVGAAKCTQKSPRTAGPSPRRGWAGSIPEPRRPAVREGESPPRATRRPACEETRHMSVAPTPPGREISVHSSAGSAGLAAPSARPEAVRAAKMLLRARSRFSAMRACSSRPGHGSVLCDPWFTPAYFGSWFPFPRNDRLDPERFGRPDFLYVSHLHRDHFDPAFLARHVDKGARVLLPDFPTPFLAAGARGPRVPPLRATRATASRSRSTASRSRSSR